MDTVPQGGGWVVLEQLRLTGVSVHRRQGAVARATHDPLVRDADHGATASSLEKAIALYERCGEDQMASALYAFAGMTPLARGEAEQPSGRSRRR